MDRTKKVKSKKLFVNIKANPTYKLKYRNITGTSFHGQTLVTCFDNLFKVFGELSDSSYVDDKVSSEWTIIHEPTGTLLTIYDWKEAYKPLYIANRKDVYRWHIGSYEPLPTEIFEQLKMYIDA